MGIFEITNAQWRSDASLLLMVDFGREPKNALVIHKGTQVSLFCLMQFVGFCVWIYVWETEVWNIEFYMLLVQNGHKWLVTGMPHYEDT